MNKVETEIKKSKEKYKGLSVETIMITALIECTTDELYDFTTSTLNYEWDIRNFLKNTVKNHYLKNGLS